MRLNECHRDPSCLLRARAVRGPLYQTEREVSHLFRRYDGFQSVRMRAIESSKAPGTNLFLCFAEFDNSHQATVALVGLNGYRLDPKVEVSAVKISYAKAKGARGPPPPRAPPPQYDGGYGATQYMPREAGGPPREERRGGDERDRYDDDRRGGYDDRGGGRDERDYDGDDRRGYRRGQEHDDRYRDDYEDSEVGDNDVFQRAEQVSMHGITDT